VSYTMSGLASRSPFIEVKTELSEYLRLALRPAALALPSGSGAWAP
jgi:hypothetical protein